MRGNESGAVRAATTLGPEKDKASTTNGEPGYDGKDWRPEEHNWRVEAMRPAHLRRVAELCADALTPWVDSDWSVAAGSLEWDVERTIAHMVGATAKYTLYLASGCRHFIPLTCSRFDDATHAELVESIRPVAEGLANVADWVPAGTVAFHATGLKDGEGFVSMACEELLLHTHDALKGLGGVFSPNRDLAAAVLASAYPNANAGKDPWSSLLAASGRPAFEAGSEWRLVNP